MVRGNGGGGRIEVGQEKNMLVATTEKRRKGRVTSEGLIQRERRKISIRRVIKPCGGTKAFSGVVPLVPPS
jgi:hypothetical protein